MVFKAPGIRLKLHWLAIVISSVALALLSAAPATADPGEPEASTALGIAYGNYSDAYVRAADLDNYIYDELTARNTNLQNDPMVSQNTKNACTLLKAAAIVRKDEAESEIADAYFWWNEATGEYEFERWSQCILYCIAADNDSEQAQDKLDDGFESAFDLEYELQLAGY